MRHTAYSGPLFLTLILSAFTPSPLAHAQTAPAAGTSVSVKMVEAVDSGIDPAGKQYRASVTKAVDAGNGVTIPQGAIAAVTLAKGGTGWTTQLASVTINGQVVPVASGSASVTSNAQSAAGSAVSSVNSVLGGFGHHVNPPPAVAAVATGQRVVLPPGITLTFVLTRPPAASPAVPHSSQPIVASAAPVPAPPVGPAGAAAPGQNWWMCNYRDVKDPYKPAAGSRMYYALVPASEAVANGTHGLNDHFSAYVRQNYKVNDNATAGATGYGGCQRFSNDAATRANSMDMLQKQWASSNIESIHVNWTNSAAENAAIDAKLAGAASVAATAAATATAAPNQQYVWCNSAWGGTAGTMMPAGTVMYFSDVFPADMPPPLTPSPGHPLPANADGARINRINALQTAFFAVLQKKYGYKDSGNYPVDCRAGYPPSAAGLQNAQKYRQEFEDLARHNNGQIVETGWQGQ